MNNKRWPVLFCFLFFLMGGLLILQLLKKAEPEAVDMAAVNRIVKQTELYWQDVQDKVFTKDISTPYEYSVIGLDERLLYRSGESAPVTIHEAVQANNTVLDVTRDGAVCGKVLIATNYEKRLMEARKQLNTAAFSLFFLLLIPAVFYTIFLNRLILTPFQNLKDFARHIALGNLDAPLPMDKSHIFGAFTESFDIMREQLKEYRQREASAVQSKKELAASLSHDIKTPVSSIKLVSELLLATESEKALREKLQTIYQKSEQIDFLITNMLQASLEDLGELQVNPAEESSSILEEMIRQADFYGKADILPVPGCLLWFDPMRMEQVIGNIINNAYKYADAPMASCGFDKLDETGKPRVSGKPHETGKLHESGKPIAVVSSLTADGLCIEFRDFGKGVPDEELIYLFQKFYRGTPHAKKSDGSGLGLYISRCLMEKMSGAITCFNREDGFSVELFIPFAGRPV